MTYLLNMRNTLQPEETMSYLTPMLLLWSSPQVFPSPHFFMSTFSFFLLSQIPFSGNDLFYHLIRSDKKTWIKQQISLIAIANIFLIVFFFFTSNIIMLPHLSLEFTWDNNLYIWQELQKGTWSTYIPYAIVYQSSLIQSFFCAAGLWWLYGFFGGLMLLVLRLCFPRSRNAGLSALFCVYFYDYLCEYFLPYAARYFSPVALSRISYLNWGYDPHYPSIKHALFFFIVFCVIFILISIWLGNRIEIDKLSSRTDK